MAKKKAKVLKTLTGRIKMTRSRADKSEDFPECENGYRLFTTDDISLGNRLCETAIHSIFGRVLCPVNKTATVKITIEVEKIE